MHASSASSPIAATCDTQLALILADGRSLSAPLFWYPRLLQASAAERSDIELSPLGMHWPKIDEDISVASIFRGERAPGAKAPA
jgi:hypothetical protein